MPRLGTESVPGVASLFQKHKVGRKRSPCAAGFLVETNQLHQVGPVVGAQAVELRRTGDDGEVCSHFQTLLEVHLIDRHRKQNIATSFRFLSISQKLFRFRSKSEGGRLFFYDGSRGRIVRRQPDWVYDPLQLILLCLENAGTSQASTKR